MATPDDTARSDATEPEQVTHEELAAAAIAELIEERQSSKDSSKSSKPPEWLRKAYENT